MNIKTFSIHAVRNLFAFFIALGLGYVAYTVNPTSVVPTKVEAGASQNVSGWAYSKGAGTVLNDGNTGVGWISFNSYDCDVDKNGFVDSGSCGGDNTTKIARDYGVKINTTDGTFSGYAYSEYVDAISFTLADLSICPVGATVAKVDLVTGNVTGWARALTGSASPSWDGCIKFSDETNSWWAGKGVKIDISTGKFSGYAYGGDVMGWISFNCATDGSCASSNYFVQGPVLNVPCTPGSCSGGLVCNTTTSVCIVPNGACSTSADCGGGQQCNSNLRCVTLDGSCSTTNDCAGGQICNASGMCVAPVGGYCNTSTDCFNGQICNTTTHACYDKPKTKFWQF